MAVTIRLARHGQKKAPFYRIVAADKEARRDGRFLEIVGTFNPMTEPPAIVLKEESIKKWIENGAKPSTVVADIIKKNIPGYLEEREKHQLEKIQARRRARKARPGYAAGRAKSREEKKAKTEARTARKTAAKVEK